MKAQLGKVWGVGKIHASWQQNMCSYFFKIQHTSPQPTGLKQLATKR